MNFCAHRGISLVVSVPDVNFEASVCYECGNDFLSKHLRGVQVVSKGDGNNGKDRKCDEEGSSEREFKFSVGAEGGGS